MAIPLEAEMVLAQPEVCPECFGKKVVRCVDGRKRTCRRCGGVGLVTKISLTEIADTLKAIMFE